MIQIILGRPKVSVRQKAEEGEVTDQQGQPLFTLQNFVLLGIGIAVGVIMVQQSQINALKNTVVYLQEVIR